MQKYEGKMQQEKQFLVDLKKHFRLNIYEVKIWTSLLSRGIASAGELADISGVPRSRCYDVLESLEKKGFIIMKIGKPIKYLAVQPSIILERVKKGIEDESTQTLSQIEGIKDTEEFKELELLHKTGVQHFDVTTISKSIVGRTAINRQIKELFAKATSEVLFVASSDNSERAAKLLKSGNFAKKGVNAKLYCTYNKNVLRKLQNVQHIEHNASTSFVIVDGKQMVFMVSNQTTPDYEVAIWINSPFFVNALGILFRESMK
ncbi:MAG TPA: helix-turn-helix domain-containing protein [Candidatus Nanoarchaeia archaeon]|nr:helix-turn-helix domain-containing protein [Candidatus Nanoarchaeia archaeon]